MLNNEEVPRGVPPQPGRRTAPTTRIQDNRFNSPSSSYNYNSTAGYNQSNGFGGQQHPRRRIDRFKRETINYSDRLIRQNDSIIRLLKEIRDRLPAPPASIAQSNEPDQVVQDGSFSAGQTENNEPAAESMDQGIDQGTDSDQAYENRVEPQTE